MVSTSDCGSGLLFKSHQSGEKCSTLTGSYPDLGVLRAQWAGWDHTAKLPPLHGRVFESVALTTWLTLQVPQFPGLLNTRVIMVESVVCSLSSSLKPKWTSAASPVTILILIYQCIQNVSASVAPHAMLLWWPQSRCSCHFPCLRQFRSKPSTSQSLYRRFDGGTKWQSVPWRGCSLSLTAT